MRDPDGYLTNKPERTKAISYNEGQKVKNEIGGKKYVECSALTQKNLKTVFDEAIG